MNVFCGRSMCIDYGRNNSQVFFIASRVQESAVMGRSICNYEYPCIPSQIYLVQYQFMRHYSKVGGFCSRDFGIVIKSLQRRSSDDTTTSADTISPLSEERNIVAYIWLRHTQGSRQVTSTFEFILTVAHRIIWR